MKKRTKADIYGDHFTAFKCVKNGFEPKRATNKDGSLPTIPTVPVPDLHESEVLALVLSWLKGRGIFCNRLNNGKGVFQGAENYGSYGIEGAGDILGLLRDGRHFEIECKRGSGGVLSKAQQRRYRDITKNNGLYLVIHGIPELEYYMEKKI
jgi:hypothetical protein